MYAPRRGQDPNVLEYQRTLSVNSAVKLKKLLKPILLQRKKVDFEHVLQLPQKTEVVVWVPLSSKQRDMYRKYLGGRQLQKVLSQSTYPIEAVNYLKTLCRHPLLLEATPNHKNRSFSTLDDMSDLSEALNTLKIGLKTKLDAPKVSCELKFDCCSLINVI